MHIYIHCAAVTRSPSPYDIVDASSDAARRLSDSWQLTTARVQRRLDLVHRAGLKAASSQVPSKHYQVGNPQADDVAPKRNSPAPRRASRSSATKVLAERRPSTAPDVQSKLIHGALQNPERDIHPARSSLHSREAPIVCAAAEQPEPAEGVLRVTAPLSMYEQALQRSLDTVDKELKDTHETKVRCVLHALRSDMICRLDNPVGCPPATTPDWGPEQPLNNP